MKRSRTDSETALLNKRRKVAKVLRTMKDNEDGQLREDEKYGDYEIRDFEGGLKKALERLEKWDVEGGASVRERGNELATLMRDTARRHGERYVEAVKEYERLNKKPALARTAQHLEATKELFGVVLDQRSEFMLTVDEARRRVDKDRCADTHLENFEKWTEELNKILDADYRTLDSDQMTSVLVVCRMEGAHSRWCKKMTFWE